MEKGLENINCPVCNYNDSMPYLETFDRFENPRKKSYQIVKCRNCDFIYLNPRPDAQHIGNYYAVDGYDPFLSEEQQPGLRDRIYFLLRTFNLAFKYRKIKKQKNKPGRILDIGCATGEFLDKFQNKGWHCTGVEVALQAREITTRRNIQVFPSIHDIPGETEKFDLITMWHVLEHVHDLQNTVAKIDSLLDDDGLLVIAVPNIESHDAQEYKQNWIALDTPRHLYHFSNKSMAKLFGAYHLKIIDVHTLLLDILYNNLLSKKPGMRGSFAFINTLMQSLAKTYLGSLDNSSSLVYYLKREKDNE